MIKDINASKNGFHFDADICIIGAGAAGIALALELSRAGKSVTILEGGGMESTEISQSLYDLDTTNLPIKRESRMRVFGGTTTVWSGGWKPFDEIDFEKRDGIPLSGWPIKRSELVPYYDRAAEIFGGPKISAFDPSHFKSPLPTSFSSQIIRPTVLRILPHNCFDFGRKFREEIESSEKNSVLLNANVTKIEKDSVSSKISRLHTKTLSGNSYTVTAQSFIVASGGIENARLLLASNIRNKYDQVGRYYMDHPKGTLGTIKLRANNPIIESNLGWQGKDEKSIVGIALSETYAKKNKLLNSYVQLLPNFGNSLFSKLPLFRRTQSISLRNFMEQSPEPYNRVTLSEKTDALGNPLAKISWSISKLDKKSLCTLHHAIKDEFSRLRIGDLESPLLTSLPDTWPITTGASHHTGTTRMGTDPRTSVVDADCKVHDIDNLFIAGSSVFPTSSHANPTATILALAVRLANHISTQTL